ncbi:RNA polymerase sigma factor [Paludibaculum fermentans]|uniref:RNA polymerase sigma factor n=1 Tax=Paludibaculum fermentans TaxID=1473598 RepID=UPI003EBF14EA
MGGRTATGSLLDERAAIEQFLARQDEITFSDLFRIISPRVFSYLRLHGCERGVAEDLTQEVMLAVYTQCRTLRDHELFRPWLFRIARNCWLQHVRRSSRQVSTSDIESTSEHLCSTNEDPLRKLAMAEWLRWLHAEDRELVLLRFVQGLEYHEIAEVLGTPTGTVQWRLFNIKKRLAQRFGLQPV